MLTRQGPQRCAAAPFSVQPGSAALGGAGLTVRLTVVVAGLLPATGPALPALTTGATTDGAAHPGRQRRGRPRG